MKYIWTNQTNTILWEAVITSLILSVLFMQRLDKKFCKDYNKNLLFVLTQKTMKLIIAFGSFIIGMAEGKFKLEAEKGIVNHWMKMLLSLTLKYVC